MSEGNGCPSAVGETPYRALTGEVLSDSGLKVILGAGDWPRVVSGETRDSGLMVEILPGDGGAAGDSALRCSFGEVLRAAAF